MRILLADDSPSSLHMLAATVRKWGYEPVLARDGEEAWHLLQQHDSPRLAILDWEMPGVTGPEVCRRIRGQGSEPYTYVLLLTSKSETVDVVEGMEAGADDYVAKPFVSAELKVRLRAGRRIVELQEELLAAREALREQATHDSLTGLWNRGSILEILERELSRSEREGTPVGILMADIDYFKAINDAHTHIAGDQVLRETARRMLSSVRGYDAVGRYGGEEFLIVLPGCDGHATLNNAERLREAISGHPVDAGEEGLLSVTASFGATTYCGEALPTTQAVIRLADEALYRAKAGGRNRSEFLPLRLSARKR